MTSADVAAAKPGRKVRWIPGLILLVLAPLAIIASWWIAGEVSDGDRTIQMVAGIAALSVAFLIQVIWWTFFARLSWRAWFIGVASLTVLALVALGTLRFEGHSGEMLPTGVRFVWQETAEEKAIAYFRKAPQSAVPTADLTTSVVVTEEDWPQYRGTNRDGVRADAQIRTNWEDAPPKEVWRHPVGPGWSSFAVVGDRLFTQEQRGEEEVVVCYGAREGEQLWVHSDRARFSESLGGDGPRGTPTVVDSRVYALGGTGLLNCLDAATGEAVWQRDILKDAGDGERVGNIDWGMAGSPLVREGLVYVAPGGEKGKSVIAYDAASGEIRWGSGNANASYAAPRIETIEGVPQLLVFDGDGLKSYDPSNGEVLWTFGPWTNQPKVNAAQPIVEGNRVFISSGYTIGSVLLRVEATDEGWKVSEVWRNDSKFKLKFNDGVLKDGYLYGLDEGILACLEFETGKQQWKKGRYGYGQVILLGETLVVLAEDGTLAAVKATPESFEEVARVPVLDGKTWNHPAYSRGLLFVRNDREAACFEIAGDE